MLGGIGGGVGGVGRRAAENEMVGIASLVDMGLSGLWGVVRVREA